MALEKEIEEKKKEVDAKYKLYSEAKIVFVQTKSDWQSAQSDLEDLKRQQKA